MTSHLPAFPSLLSDDDVRLFSAGRHHRLYDKLGAHLGVCPRNNILNDMRH